MNEQINSAIRSARALARVALLLASVLSLVLILSFRASVARADDTMLEFGRHLIALSETGIGSGERGLLINDQQLGFRVFTARQDLNTALDFYESWCHGDDTDFPGQEKALVLQTHSEGVAPVGSSRSWKDLALRSQRENIGMVACLKHGLVDPSGEELAARLMAFLETGNLGELGQFHYAAVTAFEGSARVVTLWSEPNFYPLAMFPAEGDAPGFDPSGISRPPSGRRMLSAGEFGHDETLAIYIDCEESIDALARFYRLDFVRQGWRLESDISEGTGSRILIVQRSGETRAVSLQQEPGELVSVTFATAR